MRRKCTNCKKLKLLDEFYKRQHYNYPSEQYTKYCKKCVKGCCEQRYKTGGKQKDAIRFKNWIQLNRTKYNNRQRKYYWNLKLKVLKEYGGKCECCQEQEPKFLTIDHINNDGNIHRKQIGNQSIYIWLNKHKFPKGQVQILCFNCNMSKAAYGCCPHQQNQLLT